MADDSLPKTARAAKLAGAKYYWTGVPCKFGHMAKRTTNDRRCVDCIPRRSTEAYFKHHEKNLELRRRWKDANRPRIAAYMREYNAANAEHISEAKKVCYRNKHAEYRAKGRAYWHANKEVLIPLNRRWIEANRDKARAYALKWARENPEYAAFRNRRTREATPAWLTDAQRDEMLAIYAEAVRLSCETGIPREVDHIVPLLGENVCGLHVPQNLQILTRTQNRSKGNKHGE